MLTITSIVRYLNHWYVVNYELADGTIHSTILPRHEDATPKAGYIGCMPVSMLTFTHTPDLFTEVGTQLAKM